MLLLTSNSVYVVKFFLYDITFFTMSLTNENVVQIYKKKHNGSMNGVHKEICETLHVDTFQINKSSLHWKIKKNYQRISKTE